MLSRIRRSVCVTVMVLLVLAGGYAPPARAQGGGTGTDALAADGWSSAGNLNVARMGHTATLLADGRVLVAGGYYGGSHLSSAELYDPTTGQWTLTGEMNLSRHHPAAIRLQDGRVLITGGHSSPGVGEASAEVYDPETGLWSPAGNMHALRWLHTMVLLPDGRVLVVGGTDASTELFDPATGQFALTGSMSVTRYSLGATLLIDGRVLVSGGCSGDNFATSFSSAEIYDPTSGQWTLTGSMSTARNRHTATRLADGRVLVAGGCSGGAGCPSSLASAELYDPLSGSWSGAASLQRDRTQHSAILLPDGQVLVAGGSADGDAAVALSATEIYDPSADQWSPAAGLATARNVHAAAPMSDGGLLVCGGCTSIWNIFSSAEVYSWEPSSSDLLLAQKFSPWLYLHEGEHFDPEEVGIFIDHAALQSEEQLTRPWTAPLIDYAQVTAAGLAVYGGEAWSRTFLDLLEPRQGAEGNNYSEYKDRYGEFKDGYAPTAYTSVQPDGSHLTVQYWFFYYFNDGPYNAHEGDWEQITLVFDAPSADEALVNGLNPVSAAYSQHIVVLRRPWSEVTTEEGHPVVYVGRGSHANYYSLGPKLVDQVGRDRLVKPIVKLVTKTQPVWMAYSGYWGQRLSRVIDDSSYVVESSSSGPPSIAPRTQFREPYRSSALLDELIVAEFAQEQSFSDVLDAARLGWITLDIRSPAEPHITDELGRHSGRREDGSLELQIPGSMYFATETGEEKVLLVPRMSASSTYNISVLATAEGEATISMGIPHYATRQAWANQLSALTMQEGSAIQFVESTSAVSIYLDVDGNGTWDSSLTPNREAVVDMTIFKAVYLPIVLRAW